MSVLTRFIASAAIGGLSTIFLGTSTESNAKAEAKLDQPDAVMTNNLSKDAVKATLQKQSLTPKT